MTDPSRYFSAAVVTSTLFVSTEALKKVFGEPFVFRVYSFMHINLCNCACQLGIETKAGTEVTDNKVYAIKRHLYHSCWIPKQSLKFPHMIFVDGIEVPWHLHFCWTAERCIQY